MNVNDDFFGDAPTMPTGRGGKRPRAGRKAKSEMAPAPGSGEQQLTPYQRFDIARADKEEALARQAQVKADLEEGLTVLRTEVESEVAKAFAACSQALDAIGDNLERDGIEPLVCEKVMAHINEAKAQLARDLEAMMRAEDEDELEDDADRPANPNDSFF